MDQQNGQAEREAPSVYEHIFMLMETMAHVSWQKLGLQPDTITGKLDANIAEAKVAIDVVAHLAGVIEPKLDEEDRRRIQNLLRDLRINFIQRTPGTTL